MNELVNRILKIRDLFQIMLKINNNDKVCLVPTVAIAQDTIVGGRRKASLKQGNLFGDIILKPRPERQLEFKLSKEGRDRWGKEKKNPGRYCLYDDLTM